MREPRPIRTMTSELALKIAAGEVVERPASAVKELIDNAIDAGATRIAVEVREGGLKLIRVSDDGCGIMRADLRRAFASHATSKIATLDDLGHLSTLGFRGEALPSIAAVSRVDTQTRASNEEMGGQLRIEFGDILWEGACSAARGTRISVSDLFSNVPARRKFVRSLRAEGGQIAAVVMQYAMAQPGIQFSLTIDGKSSFASPGTGELRDAFAAVHGPNSAGQMLALDVEHAGIAIAGLISAPALNRANRSAIHIFVNGRPIASRSLPFALEEAYSGFLMTGRHPLAAIHITVDPSEVDPNIHPSKSDVRFARDREVHGTLHRAVASTLLEMRLAERPISVDTHTPQFDDAEDVALPLGAEAPPAEELPLSPIPALRVFGQTSAAFIIAEGPQGLYMIDQHAAHERVLFDQLDQQFDGGAVTSQALLEPAPVHLEAAQMQALEENRPLLRQAGFDLEPFGHDTCLVRAVPALAGRGNPVELVSEVLTELQNLPEPAAARERALAAMACRGAIKAGQTLDVQEMRELIALLERTPRPATCPHGRPTMIHLSLTQLEREFGRR